jgi:S-(hydroxymethyl)glutathione dehydrogenase/alcohol dehydrogenase
LTNSEKIGKSNLCLCVSACVHTRTSWLIGNVEELQAGGVAVILGLAADKDNVTFHPSTLLYGRTWTSGLFGGYKGRTDLPGLVEKYMDGV